MEMQLILKEWGIWSTGTIRENRTRGCSLKTDKEMKKAGRGSVDISVEKSTGLEVIKWMDNRSVMVSSTYLGVRPIGTVIRWDSKNKKDIEVRLLSCSVTNFQCIRRFLV
jgi:hypothetical protein